MTRTTKRSNTMAFPSQPYEAVDFVAAGLAATQEESQRLNNSRRMGLDVAAYLRQVDPEGVFASLPAQFQPLVGTLVAVGAEPSNFVLNTSRDGTIHLLGTLLAPEGDGWRIFQASGRVGDARDIDVVMRNLGASREDEQGHLFATIEEAFEVLRQIGGGCMVEPNLDLVGQLETGGRWLS